MNFERYIGIDYSGRGEPTQRTSGIQVVEMDWDGNVRRVSPDGRTHSWSRVEVFEYLCHVFETSSGPAVVGVDHSFSFPIRYFKDQGLKNWDEFLVHFNQLWATKELPVRVAREQVPPYPNHTELRRTEAHTSSAKSAWNFEQKTGTVAYSTHAGIPWIFALRQRFSRSLHMWPYDGWEPSGQTHLLAEVYPALLYQRFKQRPNFPSEWTRDAQDAYVIAAWLHERDQNQTLATYFRVNTLTDDEKQIASQCEGWILGVF